MLSTCEADRSAKSGFPSNDPARSSVSATRYEKKLCVSAPLSCGRTTAMASSTCHPADLVDAAFHEQSEGEGDVGYGIGADEVTSENRWRQTGGVAVSELVDLAHNGVD